MGLIAVLVAVATPTPGGTQTERQTTCILWNLVEISPGLTLKPGSGTFDHQAPGTIECDGPVLGHRPTGPGIFAVNHGRYEASCGNTSSMNKLAGGSGTFVHGFRIPTEDGELQIDDDGTFTVGLLQGGNVFGGTFTGRVASGRIRVMPVRGDCVTAPLTVVEARSEMTFNR
jgi:hypothetical protein